MTQAGELEDATPKHPVTPGAVLPARELLGDLHSLLGDFAAAREAYRASDERSPDRFNTVLGLARSATALGDAEAARSAYQRLLDQAAPDSERLAVRDARTYVEGAAAP
jgi:tetratricopeptide (TPR) repeat protein